MATFRNTASLNYDDVLLVPKYSEVFHREYANTDSRLFRTGSTFGIIRVPIIAANMESVSSYEMIKEMYLNGGLCFLHRYMSQENTINLIERLFDDNIPHVIPSIGVGKEQVELARLYADVGVEAVCIDIAHGDCKQMLYTIESIKKIDSNYKIIAGNVATAESAYRLWNAGADSVKAGIGGGHACTTRNNTGFGYPLLTGIIEIKKKFDSIREHARPTLIADGGIRQVGDITKALAAGADFVMSGYMFAGCPETPSVIEANGVSKIIYRGMASEGAQTKYKGFAKNIEGRSVEVESKPPVSVILKQIKEGIQSGLSYSGARNIKELQKKAEFIILKK